MTTPENFRAGGRTFMYNPDKQMYESTLNDSFYFGDSCPQTCPQLNAMVLIAKKDSSNNYKYNAARETVTFVSATMVNKKREEGGGVRKKRRASKKKSNRRRRRTSKK
jgi:hypothetical protein